MDRNETIARIFEGLFVLIGIVALGHFVTTCLTHDSSKPAPAPAGCTMRIESHPTDGGANG